MGREKKKTGITEPLTVEEFRQLVNKAAVVPNDDRKAYIIHAEINNGKQFCIVWTTNKLHNRQQQQPNLHVDATYKITSYGFPMLVFSF
jgi:hypothetical protein